MLPTIAENLRRVMDECGVDAVELARRLGYGGRATIDHWLSGRRVLTHKNASRAAKALGRPLHDLDPDGEAYTPRRRKTRAAEKRSLQKSQSGPDKSDIAPKLPPPEAGVLMSGGLPPIPDEDLFRELLGVWYLLRGHDARRKFVEQAREDLGLSRERSARAKNNRR
jgi:transcriptional regulator with XRE-family HTH domain